MKTNEQLSEILRNHLSVDNRPTADILDSLTLIVFQDETDIHDLYYLSKILPHENLLNVIDYYDGETIRLPSKKEYRESILVILAFFLKEILGKNWNDVKEILGLKDKNNTKGLAIGRKLNALRDDMKEKIHKQLKNLNVEEVSIIIDTLYKKKK